MVLACIHASKRAHTSTRSDPAAHTPPYLLRPFFRSRRLKGLVSLVHSWATALEGGGGGQAYKDDKRIRGSALG